MAELVGIAEGLTPVLQVIILTIFIIVFKDEIAHKFFGIKNGNGAARRFDAIDREIASLKENHAAHILEEIQDVKEIQKNMCQKLEKMLAHLESIRVDGVRLRQ